MPHGRTSKLTPQRQEKIVQALLAGNFFETACRYAGVSRQAGYEWLARGEGRHRNRKENAAFAEFAGAIRDAEAQAEVHAVAIVRQGFPDNPRLALDFLARRYPERWAQRETITILRKMAEEAEAMSDDELLALICRRGEGDAAAADPAGGGAQTRPDAGSGSSPEPVS